MTLPAWVKYYIYEPLARSAHARRLLCRHRLDLQLPSPLTGTLEVTFRLDDPGNGPAYEVTFLDLTVDPITKDPTAVRTAANHYEPLRPVFRVPNFGGSDRRVVVVVSKVANVPQAKFEITASLTDRDTQPVAAPNPFSPNTDPRNETSQISYFLPPFPSTDPFNDNVYDVDVDVVDGAAVQPVGRVTQAMRQTQVTTAIGSAAGGSLLYRDVIVI